MDMNLRQLKMLREVAVRGTIAAAAEALGYTPSAVSQQLGMLEKSTGVAVLERVGRNVRLTDAGRELVHHTSSVMTSLEKAQAALEQAATAVQGRLVVSVFESIAAAMAGPLVVRLNAAHPDLLIQTKQADPDAAIDDLAQGTLDAAFFVDYPHAPGRRPPGIERHVLGDDRFHLVVPEGDPLVEQAARSNDGAVPLKAVAGRPFVASPPNLSCGRCVAQACRDAGFEPRVLHELDDFPTTLRLVAAGAGVALVPDLGLLDRPAGVVTLALAKPIWREVQIAYRSTSAGRPALQALLATATELAAEIGLGSHRDRRPA